jgi:predicted phosphoribosyltransferase
MRQEMAAQASAGIRDLPEYKNREFVFLDRRDAGEVLSRMLRRKYAQRNTLSVLAIPSGGVPVGLEISGRLELVFDLVIVRKIQIPGNTEAGFGAMTQEGSVFLNERLLAELRLTPEEVEVQADTVRKELQRRNRLFRDDRPFPDLEGRTAIIVDDGLASGYTMKASIFAVRKQKAEHIVVAVPTAPIQALEMIEPVVDEVYCPNIREGPYFAVAAAYESWYDLDEEEVMQLLKERKNAHPRR